MATPQCTRRGADDVGNPGADDDQAACVPDDFPRERWPGLLPGSQPKPLVSEKNGRHYTGPAGDELWMRYDAREDLPVSYRCTPRERRLGFVRCWTMHPIGLRKV